MSLDSEAMKNQEEANPDESEGEVFCEESLVRRW